MRKTAKFASRSLLLRFSTASLSGLKKPRLNQEGSPILPEDPLLYHFPGFEDPTRGATPLVAAFLSHV